MPRPAILLPLLLFCVEIDAQQPVPVELLTDPEKYSFSLSGNLMGNIDKKELDTETKDAQMSGRIFLDAWITPQLFLSIHINALQSQAYHVDSAKLAGLSFTHNNYKFNIATAYRKPLGTEEEHQLFAFADYSISSTTYRQGNGAKLLSTEFNTYKINLGLQFSWRADWEQNLLVHTSFKFNYMWIEDPPDDPSALERVFAIPGEVRLARVYGGVAFKTMIQLHHFTVQFETQNNFSGKKSRHGTPIPGFTKHTFYSIGFTTTSNAILGKRKKLPAVEMGDDS